MFGGETADFFQEGTAEGAHVGIAAGVGELGESHVRVPHEETGPGDTAGIDEMAEIDVQFLREEMGQVR